MTDLLGFRFDLLRNVLSGIIIGILRNMFIIFVRGINKFVNNATRYGLF